MADQDKKQQSPKPVPLDGGAAAGKTTAKGPHGGGTSYNQMAIGKGFMTHSPITGHTQKSNVKPVKGQEGGSK
jgi:hypothetical protein